MPRRKLPARFIPDDWQTCPTCDGVGTIASETSYDQAMHRVSRHGAALGELVCPTCIGAKEVAARVCPGCRHLPSLCACPVTCGRCTEPALGAFWIVDPPRYESFCPKHPPLPGTPAVRITPPERGVLLVLTFERRLSLRQRALGAPLRDGLPPYPEKNRP